MNGWINRGEEYMERGREEWGKREEGKEKERREG